MSDTVVIATERFFLYTSADWKSLVVWDVEEQHTLGQLEGHDEDIRVVLSVHFCGLGDYQGKITRQSVPTLLPRSLRQFYSE